MSDQKDQPYTIAGREMIADTPDLRVQNRTLTEGQKIPWRHHTAVSDTFICLERPVLVETRSADGDQALTPGERYSTQPKMEYRATGKDGGGCRFVIVQGASKYNYIPAAG